MLGARVLIVDRGNALELADGRNALGFARLEELFDTGKTLRDVARRRDTARVEGTHRKLCTGLADGLRRNDADRLAHLDGKGGRHILAVALRAHAVARGAVEDGADGNAALLIAVERRDGLCHALRDHVVALDQHFAVVVEDVLGGESARQTVFQRLDDVARRVGDRLDEGGTGLSARAAVLFADDDVLRDVDETAGQIARVCRLERGIGKALSAAVRGDEVLKNGKAVSEARLDGDLDLLALRVDHESAHAGELLDLVDGTARARVRHHPDGVELIAWRPAL